MLIPLPHPEVHIYDIIDFIINKILLILYISSSWSPVAMHSFSCIDHDLNAVINSKYIH